MLSCARPWRRAPRGIATKSATRSGSGIPEDPADLAVDLHIAPLGVQTAKEGLLVPPQGPVQLARRAIRLLGGQAPVTGAVIPIDGGLQDTNLPFKLLDL